MRKKENDCILYFLAAAVVTIAVIIMFPDKGPPLDQISQVRQQIKSEQMIQ